MDPTDDRPLMLSDAAKLLSGYTAQLAEAMTYIAAAIARHTNDPDAVVSAFEELAVMPQLSANPVAKELLWRMARNLHDWTPRG